MNIRFVLYDTNTSRSDVVVALPRLRHFDRFSLVTDDENGFILMAQKQGEKTWNAFRFAIDQQRQLQWLGQTMGNGDIVDDAINTSWGILLPVVDNGKQSWIPLNQQKFVGLGNNQLGF